MGTSQKYSALTQASLLGVHLVSSTVVGLFIGIALDRWFHSHPWLTLIFFLLGIVAGFREIIRQIKKLNSETNVKE